jgi:hypothetical protein
MTDPLGGLCEAHCWGRLEVIHDLPENIGRHLLESGRPDLLAGAARRKDDPRSQSNSVNQAAATMMTAAEYRARADALIRSADECRDIDLVVEIEAVAAEWRKLAGLADAQEALQAAIAARRD